MSIRFSSSCMVQIVIIMLFSMNTARGSEPFSYAQKADRIVTLLHENTSIPLNILNGVGLMDGKCGMKLNMVVHEYWNTFSRPQQVELNELMKGSSFQKTRIIGHFEINYDTTGSNEPALLDANDERIPQTVEQYIDSVGKYFNYSWAIEIDSLGFLPPPFQSGHNHYVVNVEEFGASIYGQTQFVDLINATVPTLWSTFIEIDNDYEGFYSSGIAGLKVTAAHEFNHASQIGRYGYWGPSQLFYYEITSTWMEDYVFTDVNDYYQYIEGPGGYPRGQFVRPNASFVTSNGLIEYSRAIWGKYIEERFSPRVMREIWDHIPTTHVLQAIDRTLIEQGSSFQKAFAEWSVWNYYTGKRANTLLYYAEGNKYPLIEERDSSYYFPTGCSLTDSVQSMSSAYIPIKLPDSRMVAIVTNLDTAMLNPYYFNQFTYDLKSIGDSTYRHLSNGIDVKLSVPDSINWSEYEIIFGSAGVHEDTWQMKYTLSQNYPNPFNPTTTISYTVPQSSLVSLKVYDLMGREVASLVNERKPAGTFFVRVDGSKWASGVYFYRIRIADQFGKQLYQDAKKVMLIK